MKKCYLCDTELESYIDENTANHEEHIIPQSLGGQLKIGGILCKECGGDKFLGGTIDKPFGDIFSLITDRLDIKKDRVTRPISLSGKLILLNSPNCIDVSLRDNVLSFKRPEYKIDSENKIAYIYANSVVAKSFKIKVEKELQEQFDDYLEYEFKIISDLTSLDEFLGFLELPFNLNNEIFEKGLTKIAVEFALYCGIEVSEIDHLIDKENRTFISKNIAIPYVPIAKAEEAIEYIRASFDKSFMSHSLVLFSQKQIDSNRRTTKQLYCFVELFGTFQYFIALNKNYQGVDIEPKTYSQKVIKAPNSNIQINSLSGKDLSIYLKELGLSYKDIEGKSLDEIKRFIEHIYNSRNKYIFKYEENIKSLVENLLQNIILNSQVDPELLELAPDIISHFYNNADTDDFRISFYRSRFINDGLVYSIFPEISEMYTKDIRKFRRYTYFKYRVLEEYVNENKSV